MPDARIPVVKKKESKEESHDNVERWMVSYADFVTLLFCFFTAMFAISNVDTNKLGKFVDSMRTAFNVTGAGANAFTIIEGVHVVMPSNVEIESDVRNMLSALLKESEGAIDVKSDSRGVVISVADKLFFETGSADIKDESKEVFDRLATALKKFPQMMRIEGHTDNVPIKNASYPSNWELSASRAINVAKYLIDAHGISPERLSTTGYAEFRPITSNDSPDGRAKNRRVDIVIMSESEINKEPG
jgi:chemotaxis protein MotB